jgi:adenosine kinase
MISVIWSGKSQNGLKLIGFGSPIVDGVFTYDSNPQLSERMKKEFSYHMTGGAENFPFDFYYEVLESTKPHLLGGSAMNAIRAANYILSFNEDLKKSVGFFGAIGKDHYGDFIKKGLEEEHVTYFFDEQENQRTATNIVLVENKERILYTDLGCSGEISFNHFLRHKDIIKNTQIFYADAYLIGKKFECFKFIYVDNSNKDDLTLILNTASDFIMKDYYDKFIEIFPYVDVLIVNKEELKMLKQMFMSKNKGLENENIPDEDFINLFSNSFEKKNDRKKRIIVNTRGKEDVIVYTKMWDGKRNSKVVLEKVPIVPNEDKFIVDLNGAGDSFAGGFMSGLILGKSEKESAYLGNLLAGEVIKLKGFQIPQNLNAEYFFKDDLQITNKYRNDDL